MVRDHQPPEEPTMADAAESLITAEMRAAIGEESEPVQLEVDRTAIRMFARSVGHVDPIFYGDPKTAVLKAQGVV